MSQVSYARLSRLIQMQTWLVLGAAGLLSCQTARGQAQKLRGVWQFNLGESDIVQRVSLEAKADSVCGRFFGQPFCGQVKNRKLAFALGDFRYEAALVGDSYMQGTFLDKERTRTKWSATKETSERPPRRWLFRPQAYYRQFSAAVPPGLKIVSGDTIATATIDASGTDANSKKVNWGGNPLNEPLYVQNAMPGDVLAIRFLKIKPNRSWAFSGRELVDNVLETSYLTQRKRERIDNAWVIDTDSSFLKLANPPAGLRRYRVPLRPFLGCVGVAPPGRETISSQQSGAFGGNMDDNFMQAGTTLYLPVFVQGAFLYLGDAHAAQADGELTGSALETSMDVELVVTLLRGQGLSTPRAENSEYIRSVGISGSLDSAIKAATTDLVRWLETEYRLSPPEAAMLMGFSLEYEVPDMVGSTISVAAKIPKRVLASLKKN